MKRQKVVEMAKPMLLPPAKDKCQQRAVGHTPETPHDATSLFYQMKIKLDTGQEATWDMAMEHCSDEMKAAWKSKLSEMGIDTSSWKVRGDKYYRKDDTSI